MDLIYAIVLIILVILLIFIVFRFVGAEEEENHLAYSKATIVPSEYLHNLVLQNYKPQTTMV